MNLKSLQKKTHLGLLIECGSLHERIVQLGVRVTQLHVANKQLETLSQTSFSSVTVKIENN
jgi:hypothetical protein